MAISTSITTDGGLTAPNAYLRVADLQHSKLGDQHVVHFCVAFYESQAAANAGKEAVCPPRQFTNVLYALGTADAPSQNPYVQAYEYLKANAYTSATDIL